MAIFSFQHDYISLKKLGVNGEPLGKGRAAAGVRYITRSAAEYVNYIGFENNRFIAQRQMQALEDAVKRKDARIVHTFIVALPVELNADQREELTDKYAWKLTRGGKSPGIFAVHTDNPDNPHLHIYFPDKEVSFHKDDLGKWHADLGESVQKLTANSKKRKELGMHPNATESLRLMWRDSCNDYLAAEGLDVRIDNRTLLEQGIARQAEKHRGPQSTVKQIASEEVNLPHAQSDIAVEEDMPKYTPQEIILGVATMDEDRQWLRDARRNMEALTKDAIDAREAAITYAKYASEQDLKADVYRDAALLAGDELAPFTRPDGSLKGIGINIFGFKWESDTRQKAKELQSEVALHEYKQSESRRLANQSFADAEQFRATAIRSEEKANALDAELEQAIKTYGNGATIEGTEQYIEESIRELVKDLSPEQVLAEHEAGSITTLQATRTLGLMGAHEYILIIEAQEQDYELQEQDYEL